MSNNIKTNINKLLKIAAVGGTVLTYQEFYDKILSKPALIEQQNAISTIQKEITELREMARESIKNDSINKTLCEKIEHIKDNLKELEQIGKSLNTKLQEQKISSGSCSEIITTAPITNETSTGSDNSEAITAVVKALTNSETQKVIEFEKLKIGELISRTHNKITELENFLVENNIEKKFIDDNFISNLITDFKNYLSTLSIEQLCILMDFLLITLVFSCLVTILFAFYGNFLIDKLSLEEKYPKLSGIIKLRRKFQHYYIITNSLIITFALLFMGYVNLLTLLNGS